MKRAAGFLPLVLLFILPAVAQSNPPAADEAVPAAAAPPTPKSSDEVKSLLAAAYARNTLASAVPYHFVASFQTFAIDGTPSGDGAIERWVDATGRTKTVRHFGDHTMTDFRDHSKALYTDDGYVGSIMSYYAGTFLDYPNFSWWGKDQRTIQTSAVSLQGAVQDCGAIQDWIEPAGYPPMPKDVFCVSRATGDLTLKQTERFSVRYQDYAPFQGQLIARRITASKGSHVRCRIKIEQLDQTVLDDAAMTPPADASPTSPEPNIWSTKSEETKPVKTGKVPVPPALKAAHASGLVEVFVLISRTGAVIDAEPLFSLSPELEDMGLQTVKMWSYKPILRNGKPLEVITLARLPLQF